MNDYEKNRLFLYITAKRYDVTNINSTNIKLTNMATTINEKTRLMVTAHLNKHLIPDITNMIMNMFYASEHANTYRPIIDEICLLVKSRNMSYLYDYFQIVKNSEPYSVVKQDDERYSLILDIMDEVMCCTCCTDHQAYRPSHIDDDPYEFIIDHAQNRFIWESYLPINGCSSFGNTCHCECLKTAISILFWKNLLTIVREKRNGLHNHLIQLKTEYNREQEVYIYEKHKYGKEFMCLSSMTKMLKVKTDIQKICLYLKLHIKRYPQYVHDFDKMYTNGITKILENE